MNINEVSAAVRAACDTLKEKKDAVYTALEGVSKKLHDDKINKMDSPVSDPLDVGDLERAVVETGAPVDGKRIVAYCKALDTSAFRDEAFASACVETIHNAAPLAEHDRDLEAELTAAIAAKEEAIRKADERVAAARKALETYRCQVSDGIVKPVLDADLYRVNAGPLQLSALGDRHVGVVYGSNASVKAQLNSLLSLIAANRRPIDADPYAHLKNLPGDFVPGIHDGVGAVYVGEKVLHNKSH